MTNCREIGFVYVLTNEFFPGLVKIGMTSRLSEDRAAELYQGSSGVPGRFEVAFRLMTSHPLAIEKRVHKLLEDFRPNRGREYFRVSVDQAIEALRGAALEVASIESWGEAVQHVRHGDRLALTLAEGDLLFIIAHPGIMAPQAEIIDVWQAHSDGDLLELMGDNNPGHVAGVSDYDKHGETDPVPYIDRHRRVRNMPITGRERLVPGDRLLWIRSHEQGQTCEVACFEMDNHCQVTSRAWDLKFDESSGHPLLPEILTYDQPPPAVTRVVQAALQMPRPRSWAPRQPEPSDSWACIGDSPQEAEYWLRQLKKP
ncbi:MULTISPECIES: GIY-YIG nuclease family protein [Microbispora]|uniref:GIY-YIG nuclease family protein n=1 Tax=Microbispora bryophytorum subsp. camponoti TaxID=1677852 RepID=A0ABR8L5V0_9ACTN|nr:MULTISPECIES: GIY-YIG nuclease family protein [Microbispora]MBD3146317.1 GIY-YIG nuclease family protein [Microbispora camponoti]